MSGLGSAIEQFAACDRPTAPAGGDDANKVWYLQHNRLFAEATEAGVERSERIFTMCEMPRGTRVFDQGDPTRVVYLVKRGAVRISRETADGKDVTVALLGPGDMFGEETLFDARPRTTVAVIVEDALLCKARAEDLFALLAQRPDARAQRRQSAEQGPRRRARHDGRPGVRARSATASCTCTASSPPSTASPVAGRHARRPAADPRRHRVAGRQHARDGQPRDRQAGRRRAGCGSTAAPSSFRTGGPLMFAAILLAAATTLAPVLTAVAPWVNAAGPPPTAGRVTVVDVFTFDCINCKHVTPELRKLRGAYAPADLAIVGVHAPELPEEHVHANVVQALQRPGHRLAGRLRRQLPDLERVRRERLADPARVRPARQAARDVRRRGLRRPARAHRARAGGREVTSEALPRAFCSRGGRTWKDDASTGTASPRARRTGRGRWRCSCW